MNRRTFLKSIGKVVAGVAFVPIVAKAKEKSFICNSKHFGIFAGTDVEGNAIDISDEIVEIYRPKQKMYYRKAGGRWVGDGWDSSNVHWQDEMYRPKQKRPVMILPKVQYIERV